jgi:hypothetical protein
MSSPAMAQRGVGRTRGVASQADKPVVVTVKGTVLEVQTEPCESTTGHALVGTHFLLETEQGKQLNIHLGPAEAVADIAVRLTENRRVMVECFRTAQMKPDHYVAKSLRIGRQTLELRDDNLRPTWAGTARAAAGRQSGATGRGWQGRGGGSGWGRGRGPGRGRGWGRGRGAADLD